jgi:peroxiredoxin Q/BCP
MVIRSTTGGTMLLLFALSSMFSGSAQAAALEPGSAAPPFELKTDKGADFKLADRRGRWTVLYFYPKDDTPGCTKQACAFRDSINLIRAKSAEVFGISKDTVESHKKFVANHKLNFTILADPDGKVIDAYGAKGFLGMAKRWTFIVDPDLKVAWIQTDVDPAMDAKVVTEELTKLQKK